MRPNNNNNQNQRRGRSNNNNNSNRGRGRSGSSQGKTSFDSNGPGVRIRGSASQVYDKYAGMAREAQSSGDPVLAENLYQHAEHYCRIAAEQEVAKEVRNAGRNTNRDKDKNESPKDDKEDGGETSREGNSEENTKEDGVVEKIKPQRATKSVDEKAIDHEEAEVAE